MTMGDRVPVRLHEEIVLATTGGGLDPRFCFLLTLILNKQQPFVTLNIG